MPARCDVGERHGVADALLGIHLLLQRNQRRVQTQLQNSEYVPTGLALELFERIEIPRVNHERLLADGVRSDAQGEPDVSIVKIIG